MLTFAIINIIMDLVRDFPKDTQHYHIDNKKLLSLSSVMSMVVQECRDMMKILRTVIEKPSKKLLFFDGT